MWPTAASAAQTTTGRRGACVNSAASGSSRADRDATAITGTRGSPRSVRQASRSGSSTSGP